MAMRLPMSDGIDPVREFKKRYSDVMSVRLPISAGIVPVRHMKKCRREF
jgi:hypothetical protein